MHVIATTCVGMRDMVFDHTALLAFTLKVLSRASGLRLERSEIVQCAIPVEVKTSIRRSTLGCYQYWLILASSFLL